MKSTKLDKACEIAIVNCMGAKPKEKILVITDNVKREIGYALYSNALKLGYEALYVEIKEMKMHGEEPPKYIAELMQKFDVVLIPTAKSMTHTNARRNASAKGVRVATFPGITKNVMIRGLNADYEKIAALTIKLTKMLDKANTARVTAPNGTDIKMVLKGRKGIASKGLFRKKGESGNLPTGEAFIAPLEGKTEGVFVVDGSMSGVGKIEDKPIKIFVEKGLVTKISGGKEARKLRSIIKPYGEKAKNIAEFGIGTNDGVRLSGNLLEDEKVLGTVHIAIGDNKSMGGKVDAPIHLDGVIRKPSVWLDDKQIMKDGKLLI